MRAVLGATIRTEPQLKAWSEWAMNCADELGPIVSNDPFVELPDSEEGV